MYTSMYTLLSSHQHLLPCVRLPKPAPQLHWKSGSGHENVCSQRLVGRCLHVRDGRGIQIFPVGCGAKSNSLNFQQQEHRRIQGSTQITNNPMFHVQVLSFDAWSNFWMDPLQDHEFPKETSFLERKLGYCLLQKNLKCFRFQSYRRTQRPTIFWSTNWLQGSGCFGAHLEF